MENQRVKKARKFFKTAKLLLERGDYDSCISRCYYALFHATVAMLEKSGMSRAKWGHNFVLASFNKEYIHRKKIFRSETGKSIHDIFEQRQEADYSTDEKSFKKAKRVLDKTDAIFHSILKELCDEKP